METNGVVHGALDFAELESLGLAPAEILDFSVNSNPYGPSPLAKAALAGVNLERYPDRDCLALRRTIIDYDISAEKPGMENLLCGNGTAELIWALARAFLYPGAKAGVIGPTFGEYRQASLVAGADIFEFRAEPEELFKPDLEKLLEWLEITQPTLLWLCNPNNPTGYFLEKAVLDKIFQYCSRNGIILVLDEAYRRFIYTGEPFSSLYLSRLKTDRLPDESRDKLVILRSLTKDYALAGLRLGYVASSDGNIEKIARQLPAWNVNAAAQVVGTAALQDQSYLTKTLADLGVERATFFTALRQGGFRVFPSTTHYCLVEVGNAGDIRRKLLQKKMLVRDCASFGLPDFIRVATRPEWPRLVAELKSLLDSRI